MSAPVTSSPPIRCGGCGSIAIWMWTIARSKRDVHHPGLRRQRVEPLEPAHRAILGAELPGDGADLRGRDLGEEGRREQRGGVALAAQQGDDLVDAAAQRRARLLGVGGSGEAEAEQSEQDQPAHRHLP